MTIQIDIDTMNANQRVELIDQLWAKFDENDFSIPDEHLKVLRERVANDPVSNDQGIAWNDLKQKLKNR